MFWAASRLFRRLSWPAAARLAGLCALLGGVSAGATDRVEFVTLSSEALGRELPLAIVRPAAEAARADEVSPVLYFLHGRGRHHASLLERPAAREALLAAGYTIVLPQGEDGWYLDSPLSPQDRYETYLCEVIAWVEAHRPVRRDAAGRGIAGWSMGGYGAVRFAERNPGTFAFVGSIIGLLDFPREETLPEGQNYRVPVERFGTDPEFWRLNNPLHRVAELRGAEVSLVLAEAGFERTMNERFIEAARAAGISPRVHILVGGHQIEVVERGLTRLLADCAAVFGRPPARR